MNNTQLLAALPPPLARQALLTALWSYYLATYKTRSNAVTQLTAKHPTIIKEVI